MEEIANRIRQLLQSRNLSVNAFSKLIGMEQVTVNRQLNGQRSPSLTLVCAILSHFTDVSAEWLLRGRDDMAVTPKGSKSDVLQRISALERAVFMDIKT